MTKRNLKNYKTCFAFESVDGGGFIKCSATTENKREKCMICKFYKTKSQIERENEEVERRCEEKGIISVSKRKMFNEKRKNGLVSEYASRLG